MSKCPNDKKYGDQVCIGGWMWELTYSEMGPPDSRQNTGNRCPLCNPEPKEAPGETLSVEFTYEGFEITTLLRRKKDGFEIIHHEMPDEAMRLSFSRMDDLALEAAHNV